MNFITAINRNKRFAAPIVANISISTNKNEYYHQLQQK